MPFGLDPGWGLAIIFAILALVFTAVNGVSYKNGCNIAMGPFGSTVATFFFIWIANSLIIWNDKPVFGGPWPANGFSELLCWDIIILVVVLIVSSALGAWSADSDNNSTSGRDYIGLGLVVLVLIGYFVSAAIPAVAGSTRDGMWPCNYNDAKGNFNGTTQYGALNVKYDPTHYPPTNSQDLIQVSEETAHLIADRNIGQMGNTSSFAQVSDNPGYLEKDPNGKLWWVETLTVKDQNAFSKNGSALPGFILVDAMVPDAPPQLVAGHHIEYIPGLGYPWGDPSKDPNTYVYYNYTKGTDLFVHGLTENENVEVQWDAEGKPQPRYTGIVLQHYIGTDINKPVGVLIFNPDTDPRNPQPPTVANGGIKVVPMSYMDESQHPEYAWLNHAYSEEDLDNAVSDFGQYGPIIKQLGIGHDDCINQGENGRVKADQAAYVMTSQGLVRQYDLTSTQADNSAKAILYVSPDTLQSTIYPLNSATSSTVAKAMENAGQSQLRKQVKAVNLQVQVLLGTTIWYSILVTDGQGPGSDGSRAGYAFITTANTLAADNSNAVLVDQTFDGAYSQLKTQIANGGGTPNPTTTSTSSSTTTVTGTVDRTGQMSKSNGPSYCYIWLSDSKYQTVTFRVSSQNEVNIAYCTKLRHGDNISMVVQTVLYGNNFTDVKSLQINKEAPTGFYMKLLNAA